MIIEMYYVTLFTVIGAYAIATLGLNITMGYAGQVNLGQAAFVGIGAFTSAILTTRLGFSFWVALPLSGLVAMGIGVLLGLVSIRLRHDFLAITTIGFNFIVVAIFLYYDLFGGSFGIINIPRPVLMGFKLKGLSYMLLVYVILAASMAFNKWIEKSWMGMAFEALREDEEAAQSMGIDVRKFKILAFSIGAGFGGIAGSLLAHFKTYIVYSDFEFPISIMILTMCIMGGMGSVYGPFVGSAIVILIPEIFRPLMQYRMVMYTVFLLLLLRFMPEGLVGRESPIDRAIRNILRREVVKPA